MDHNKDRLLLSPYSHNSEIQCNTVEFLWRKLLLFACMCGTVQYWASFVVENCVRKKSCKKCRSELRSRFPRVSIGEQVSKKRFLGKGNGRAFITLSFRRNVRRYCSVFRSMSSKTFKPLIPWNRCITVICTGIHKGGSFDAIALRNYAKIPVFVATVRFCKRFCETVYSGEF
jgi:hypothetical protein